MVILKWQRITPEQLGEPQPHSVAETTKMIAIFLYTGYIILQYSEQQVPAILHSLKLRLALTVPLLKLL